MLAMVVVLMQAGGLAVRSRVLIDFLNMPSPPIQVFLTTIASQPILRKRQGQSIAVVEGHMPCIIFTEYILRILQTKKIPFTSYDLASDEDAKRLWKRKAPLGP